jgi:hypothetical protein
MDSDSAVYSVTIAVLKELCGENASDSWGLVAFEGGIFFGNASPESQMLLSMSEIYYASDEDEMFSLFSYDELYLLFWTASIEPVSIEWYIVTEGDLLLLQQVSGEEGGESRKLKTACSKCSFCLFCFY